MGHTITLTLFVKGLTTKRDARDWAHSLSDHILETFNDNDSIDPMMGIVVERLEKGD